MPTRFFHCALLLCVSLAIVPIMAAKSTFAEGFRIETKVYVGEEKAKQQPVSETTTLFLDGAVYDFLKKPEQTAVFRKATGGKSGQFILLSDQHEVQTKIPTEKVAGVMTKIRSWAAGQRDPFLQFSAKPAFEETFDADSGKLVLASHLETYTVATAPAEHPEVVAEYREFLDWYAQLNTLLTEGQLPPEPRLRLNAVLARRKIVPLKVELKRDGEEPRRAKHEFTWRLSQDDRKRIDNVAASLTAYREVENKEFLRLTQPAQVSRSH
jgi:hypothetical protein